ncbi:MAG: selenocysteine-specific translation elongation factor [Candidatus Acidiferrales bacterium]
MKHVIVGTAGHIDHGKSSLVEALTGTHPDRLEEEKRRGITIDLGFAFLTLDDIEIGFVDVPGHERFVRNMLAGAGGIDLVLLVIAADESIKPQTREHFDICRLLGISRGLVALTKADLVDADTLGLVRLEAEEFLRGSFLEAAPIVAVSAKSGAGLSDLKRELLRVALEAPARDASRHFRLPIDRVFAQKGFGTVVTGTLVSGSVSAEDEVELFPARKLARVRGVHSGGKAVARAVAGQRTAVNLAGIELADAGRGMALASPGVFEPAQRLDARVTLLTSARALKNRVRAHFHQGTAETVAETILLDREDLRPGESAFAQLRLKESALVLPGDHFILRQFSPVVTIGGGVVLDALAPRHRRSDARVTPFLHVLERGGREDILSALVESEPRGLDMRKIIARTAWLENEVRETATKLSAVGTLRMISEAGSPDFVAVSRTAFDELSRRIQEEVSHFHAANPLLPGIPKEDLRCRVAPGARPEVFRATFGELTAAGSLAISGDLVKLAGREIALLPEEARAKEQIEREFERASLAVPRFEEVLGKLAIEAARAQKIFQILLREKSLVKVTPELVFHRSAVERLRSLIADYKNRRGEKISVAAFKELTGVSRKYAIPLLEFLDRQGVTRRAGDEHVIL